MRLSDLDGIWDVGVDLAVDAMRDSLAVTLQQFEVSDAIAVTVRGVSSFADYRAVSTVFKQLAELVELRIDSVGQDTLTYRVVGVSSAEEVARLIPSRSGLRVQSATNRAQLDLHGRAFSDRPTDSAVQHFAMVTRPRRRCVGATPIRTAERYPDALCGRCADCLLG